MAENIIINPDSVSATGSIISYVNPVAPNTVMESLMFDLRAYAEELEDTPFDLRAALTDLINLGVDFRVVISTVLLDISLDLRVTDTVILEDISLELRVAGTTPEFKSYVAHRLTSIKADTGIIL